MRTFSTNALFLSIGFIFCVLTYGLVRINGKLDALAAAPHAECAMPAEAHASPSAPGSSIPLLATAQDLAFAKATLERHIAFRGATGVTEDLGGFAFAVRKQQLEQTIAELIVRYNAIAERICGTAESTSVYAGGIRHELTCRL